MIDIVPQFPASPVCVCSEPFVGSTICWFVIGCSLALLGQVRERPLYMDNTGPFSVQKHEGRRVPTRGTPPSGRRACGGLLGQLVSYVYLCRLLA